VWIDWLVLRLLPKPQPGQKRVWIVLDELATLQRLPKFHLALTTQRKSMNPIVAGFQGKAQLEVIYGHLAEVMLSMPATSIFMRTNEPRSAEWVSNNIGKVEIERLRETRFDGTRKSRNFNQESQEQQAVMASQIQGLISMGTSSTAIT
jgi:type IV secretory pathway TraG/TraD family ATPase VirD4